MDIINNSNIDNSNIDNNTNAESNPNNSPIYLRLKEKIGEKRRNLYILKNLVSEYDKDIKEDIENLQNMCTHKYERECTTSGCYAEYDWICVYCRKYR